MELLKRAAMYWSLVFGTGFLLGTARVILVVPVVGDRTAQLLEMPVMLAAIVLAARWTNRHMGEESRSSLRVGVGLTALAMMLAAEIFVGMFLRGQSALETLLTHDPVAGLAYYFALGAFAIMPWFLWRGRNHRTPSDSPIERFIPRFDLRKRHEIIVHAPSATVLNVCRELELTSIPAVRAVFWLRSKLLGAKKTSLPHSRGFVAELLGLGWGILFDDPNTIFIAGAACRPWQSDVVFTPIPPEQFSAYAEPDHVKIAWSVEVLRMGREKTCFGTETRVQATDLAARKKFRRYWRLFGIGILMIRWLLLREIRRNAERRWRGTGSSLAADPSRSNGPS